METYDKDWLERASAGALDNMLSIGMATRLSDGIKWLEAQLAAVRAEWVKTCQSNKELEAQLSATRAEWLKSCQSNGANHDNLWIKHAGLKETLESIRFICEANIGFGEREYAIAEDILAMLGEE
jgi:hypothetical protein